MIIDNLTNSISAENKEEQNIQTEEKIPEESKKNSKRMIKIKI
jgi:hypothetical protein